MHLIGVLMGYDRNKFPDAKLRVVEPRVIFATAPNNHGQATTWLERLSYIAHGGARHHEEHRSEAREREVVGSAQVVRLYVRLEEREVAYACFAGFLRGNPDKVSGTVDSEDFASRTNALGDALRAISEAASDIQYPCTFGGIVPSKRLVAMRRQTIDK